METRGDREWKRDALEPHETVNEVVGRVLALPIGAQAEALRILVRRIVPVLPHEQRADFFCDLEDDFFG